jgi:5-methylcytosine-specific restriction endonuclease McrA
MNTPRDPFEKIAQLSEQELLARFERLVADDRANTARLLVAIAEIDERKLWARRACPSMFAFCMRFYNMSEQVTAKRLWAARTSRRFPTILAMLARGELHLNGVHLLARHLTEDNHVEVLKRARHRSSRAIEELVAELAPRPDAPSRVRAMPRKAPDRAGQPSLASDGNGVRGAREALPGRADLRSSTASRPAARASGNDNPSPLASSPLPRQTPASGSRLRPLAPRRFKVEVTIDQETHDKLRKLQDLLNRGGTGADPAAILSRAVDLLLETTLKRKAALTERPALGRRTPTTEPTALGRRKPTTGQRSRAIPAAVRRAVWLRDGGACVFVDAAGERCGANRFVEFHHRHPFGKGGDHQVENLELRCSAHNQAQADLDFGREFMRARRRSTFRAECSADNRFGRRKAPGP